MFGLILRVLFAISVHNACAIGKPVDYYTWVDAHSDYRVAWSFESKIFGDYWIMTDESAYYLFAFREQIQTVVDNGDSVDHGICFREVV